MENKQQDLNEQKKGRQDNSSLTKPDPGTEHNTDPQENMEGPVSSLMHKTGEAFDTDESKAEADERVDKGK